MARIQTFPKSRLKLDDKLILFSDVVKEYLPIGLELYDRNGLLIDANRDSIYNRLLLNIL